MSLARLDVLLVKGQRTTASVAPLASRSAIIRAFPTCGACLHPLAFPSLKRRFSCVRFALAWEGCQLGNPFRFRFAIVVYFTAGEKEVEGERRWKLFSWPTDHVDVKKK